MPIILSKKPGGGGGPGGGVTSLDGLTGAVTLSAGDGISLTPTGNDIEIAATESGLTVLFDSTLGADTAAIDSGAGGFSTTHTSLLILATLRTTQAAVASSVSWLFNNDSGANYDRQEVSITNTAVSGSLGLAANAFVTQTLGASAQAGAFSAVVIQIPAYGQTNAHKGFTHQTTRIEDTAADCLCRNGGGRWRSTAAISRVSVTSDSGNLLAGSRLIVYGLG